MLILDKYNSRLVKRVLDEIDELIDAGNDMEAEEKIEEALKTYSDTGKQFSQRLEGIRDRRLYVEALDRGRSNENGSGAELKTAIRAYQRAVEIRPDGKAHDGLALAEKIRRLQSRQAYNTALAQRDLGNKQQAEDAAKQALVLWEGNESAATLLKQLGYLEDQQALRRQALAARKAQQYEAAIRYWRDMISKYPDSNSPEIQDEIRKDRISQQLAIAKAAMSAGQFDKAREAYEAAINLKPSAAQDAMIADRMAKIKVWKKYLRLRDKGDAYLRDSRFGDAQRTYREAEEIAGEIGTEEEIIGRRADADYASWIAQTRYFVTIKNWDGATSALRSAINTLKKANRELTPEARKLSEIIANKGEGEDA